jgi:hypothetical protein
MGCLWALLFQLAIGNWQLEIETGVRAVGGGLFRD